MNKQPPYKRSSSWEAEIPKSYLSNFIATHALSTCFLILMGAAMGLISFVLQTCISCLVKISLMATSTSPSTAIDLVAYSAVFVSYAMISGVVTKLFAPGAVGSGISVMKYLLGADAGEADNYLTFPTWITKIIGVRHCTQRSTADLFAGLIFAVASGLSIGREGPNVWIASATAHLMLRYIPWFQSLSKSAALNRQIYAAACACTRVHGFVSRLTLDVMKVGVSTTFAAPIGGVLFSIEVTSTYYLLAVSQSNICTFLNKSACHKNYWKAFLAALSGATVSRLLLLTQESEAIAQGNFLQDAQVDARWHFFELPIFILLGALLGFLGSVYLSVRNVMFCR
jgi:chloride channel 2